MTSYDPVDEVQLSDAVDHDRDRIGLSFRKLSQSRTIDGGISNDEVIEPVRRQPQSLGQGERQSSTPPVQAENSLLQGSTSNGFARNSKGFAGGATHQVPFVASESLQINESKGGIQLARGPLESLVVFAIRLGDGADLGGAAHARECNRERQTLRGWIEGVASKSRRRRSESPATPSR